MYDFDADSLEKLKQLRESGIEPYPHNIQVSHTIEETLSLIGDREKEELNEGKMPEGLKNYLMKKKGKKEDKKEDMKKEGVDLFDLVKGKLIDEGVDEKEALKIMVNATEEQLQQIVEMDKMGGPAAIAGIVGAGILGAKKMVQGVKGMRDKLQQKTQQKNKMMQQSGY